MLKPIYQWVAMLSITASLFSCNREYEDFDQNTQNLKPTELGKQLPNAFTPSNMQEAFSKLLGTTNGRSTSFPVEIRTTHFYARFLPSTEEQLLQLQTDTTITLFNVPLDYEIVSEGDYYQDPSLPEGAIPYQYTVVPVDYVFPDGITFEKLSDLYLPDVDRELNDARAADTLFTLDEALENKNMFLDLLEGQAKELAGQENPTITNNEGGRIQGLFSRKPHWRAYAKLEVWNTETNAYEGVRNGEIILRRDIFSWIERRTDTNGVCDFGSPYRWDAKYILKFKTRNFTVKEGWLNTADVETGQHRNHTFERKFGGSGTWQSNKDWFYATIHNAAEVYYNGICQKYGLTRPNNKGIKALMEDDRSNHVKYRDILGSEIHLTNSKGGTLKTTKGVWATVIHELTHAGHSRFEEGIFGADDYGNNDNDNGKRILKESWAMCIEVIVISDLFDDEDYEGELMQNRLRSNMNNGYTALMIDIHDNTNQRVEHNGNTNYVNDNVTGYSLYQIERALDESRSLTTFQARLKSLYVNSTEDTELDELFPFYHTTNITFTND